MLAKFAPTDNPKASETVNRKALSVFPPRRYAPRYTRENPTTMPKAMIM